MKKFLILSFLGAMILATAFIAVEVNAYDPLDYEVVLYNNYQCNDDDWVRLGKGAFPDFTKLQNVVSGQNENWNDKVSCIKVGKNATLTIYQHTNYKGKSKTFKWTQASNGWYSLAKDWWNDSISSCKNQ
jgi:hypothetical protein